MEAVEASMSVVWILFLWLLPEADGETITDKQSNNYSTPKIFLP